MHLLNTTNGTYRTFVYKLNALKLRLALVECFRGKINNIKRKKRVQGHWIAHLRLSVHKVRKISISTSNISDSR